MKVVTGSPGPADPTWPPLSWSLAVPTGLRTPPSGGPPPTVPADTRIPAESQAAGPPPPAPTTGPTADPAARDAGSAPERTGSAAPTPAPDRPDPPPADRTDRTNRANHADLARPNWPWLAGWTLLVTGTLMVAFAVFQLWGTGAIAWWAQRQLEAQLEAQLDQASDRPLSPATPRTSDEPIPGDLPGGLIGSSPPVPADVTIAGAPGGDAPPPGDPATGSAGAPAAALMTAPPVGEPIGRIEIPSIGLTRIVAEGVDRDTLRNGPGHYPGTALPGHPGNTAIAGHRTTHGAPFYHLESIAPGDEIVVTTVEGEFRYRVISQTSPGGSEVGYRIVDPGAVQVLTDAGDNRLTLTACHPRYSARQRIVVVAELVGEPLAPPPAAVATSSASGPVTAQADLAVPGADPADTVRPTAGAVADDAAATLGWQRDALAPTILWATVCALVAHGTWILSRLWRRRWALSVGSLVFLPCLFVCFAHLDRLLPAL